MKSRPKKNAYQRELTKVMELRVKYNRIMDDLEKEGGNIAAMPISELVKLQDELESIKRVVSSKRGAPKHRKRLRQLDIYIKSLEKSLAPLRQAKELAAQHAEMAARISEPYEGSPREIRPSIPNLFSSGGLSIFERTSNPHQGAWQKIALQLQSLGKALDLQKAGGNQLAALLVPRDNDFLDDLKEGRISYGGEMAYLAIQRLKSIVYSESSLPLQKSTANMFLKQLVPATGPESVLRYDNPEFEQEVAKLILHALKYPEHKEIWLGSARTVISTVHDLKGQGIYLNCDDAKWTWELNRAWLQAAVSLGYEITLVEQHFPRVEEAILSGDSARLIAELAKEIRPQGKRGERWESQYHGGDSPTASPQEVLVLMDLGCVARKNKEGRISFSPPQRAYEAEDVLQKRGAALSTRRSHSAPPRLFDKAKGASKPPMGKPGDKSLAENFSRPGRSEDVRKKGTK